jgi:hypothetical protein
MNVRLVYLGRTYALPRGRFVIGRGSDCELRLRDDQCSRRHAMITVHEERILIDDLGSTNGVRVNGARVDERMLLRDGDEIEIGRQRMRFSIQVDDEGDDEDRKKTLRSFVTIQPATDTRELAVSVEEEPEPTHAGELRPEEREAIDGVLHTLCLVASVADRALARGKPEVAVQCLTDTLAEILADAERGRVISEEAAETAAFYAVRLAYATRKGSWLDYLFRLQARLRQPVPVRAAGLLEAAVSRVVDLDVEAFRRYTQVIAAGGFTPTLPETRAHGMILARQRFLTEA